MAPGEVPCSHHPKVMTLLRCSRCGKPICPQCAVRTPVGMRCPECAGVRGLPTYPTATGSLAKGAAAALAVGIGVGLLWGYLPSWGFYLALLLGFGVAETMAYLTGGKRGLDLQLVGWVSVALGLIVSRVVLGQRLSLEWSDINQLSPFVERAMHLELVPDGLFALIPFLIVYIRFR
ncbi:MAG: hypothetical protein KF883_07375 [Thermomicrobiales bacterium]|nr:hypothetical protein [Thermomicrobiales bacterium]